MYVNLQGELPAFTWEYFDGGVPFVGVIMFSYPLGNRGGTFIAPETRSTVIKLQDGREQVLYENTQQTMLLPFSMVTSTEVDEVAFMFESWASRGGKIKYFPNQDTAEFYNVQWKDSYNSKFLPSFVGWNEDKQRIFSFNMEVLL